MTWRFVAANFDQMHQNSNIAAVVAHPDAELVGVCDEDPSTSTGSMDAAIAEHDIPTEAVYDDLDACLDETGPDLVLGCPMNAEHANFVERVAQYDVHVAIEKPFAMTLADADRMIETMAGSDNHLVVNWPIMWDPVRHEVHRQVSAETIGDVREIQYYGGNAGAPPDDSWFYEADAGGGSMLDYLGYGVTFSTWVRDGELPEAVISETYVPPGFEVDVQSASTCVYDTGLSTYQTTWRMLSNPWEVEPQPMKGYEIIGERGSISTRERGIPIRIQTEEELEGYEVEPAELPDRFTDLAHYLVDLLETGREPEGPLDPTLCREAQRIIETAQISADRGERVALVD